MSNKHIPHRLKTWPTVYQEIVDGVKTHEFRKNDRGFRLGDLVLLEEFEPAGERYTGRSVTVEITSISHGPDWGIPEEWSVFSIRFQPCDLCGGRSAAVERRRAIDAREDETMSKLDLDAIRARWADVSPWPWQHEVAGEPELPELPRWPVAYFSSGLGARTEPQHRVLSATSTDTYAHDAADAETIAHAPEDVVALIAEVERLRSLVPACPRCNGCGQIADSPNGEP